MYKIRFNLGQGPRYKTWKISFPDGHHEYHQPDDISIILINATLKNRRKSAEVIFNGANKRVCAWVECEKLHIVDKYEFNDDLKEISYNPRIEPFWRDLKNNDIDNQHFETLRTLGNRVFEVVKVETLY